ncbi:MAG: hypothetical protein ACUZ8N_07425 [Candidatus Scalindua sp.]
MSSGHQLSTLPDFEPGSSGTCSGCRAKDITMTSMGVCRRVLKPRRYMGGSLGKVAAAANRTREIRLYGMRRGLAESWAMVELGTRRTTERVRDGNSLPTGACAVFLPDINNNTKAIIICF